MFVTMAKGGSILNDKGLVILANRRGAGEVEAHEKTNRVFIIVEREARYWIVEKLGAGGQRAAELDAREER